MDGRENTGSQAFYEIKSVSPLGRVCFESE
jgi:hypothetical protein